MTKRELVERLREHAHDPLCGLTDHQVDNVERQIYREKSYERVTNDSIKPIKETFTSPANNRVMKWVVALAAVIFAVELIRALL